MLIGLVVLGVGVLAGAVWYFGASKVEADVDTTVDTVVKDVSDVVDPAKKTGANTVHAATTVANTTTTAK